MQQSGNKTLLKTLRFEEGSKLETIGRDAFMYASLLETVVLPNSLTTLGTKNANDTIDGGVFQYCGSLSSVTIGTRIEIIPNRTFFATNLTNITIPANVKTINSQAFGEKLQTITFAEGSTLETIESNAFYSSKIEEITIPDNVTAINNLAFFNCTELKTVTIGSKLKQINPKVFLSCTSLNTLDLTNATSLTTIGAEAFSNTTSFTTLDLTNTKIETIADTALKGSSINEVKMTQAQADELELSESNATVGGKNVMLNIAKHLVSFYKLKPFSSDKGDLIKTITTDDTSGDTSIHADHFTDIKASDVGHIVIHKATTELQTLYPKYGSSRTGCFEIIGNGGNVSSIEFEEGSQLKQIGERAFFKCDSRDITIPASVEDIRTQAFTGALSLQTFTIPVNSQLRSMGLPVSYVSSGGFVLIYNFNKPHIFNGSTSVNGGEVVTVKMPNHVLSKVINSLQSDANNYTNGLTNKIMKDQLESKNIHVPRYGDSVDFLGLRKAKVVTNATKEDVKDHPSNKNRNVSNTLTDDEKEAIEIVHGPAFRKVFLSKLKEVGETELYVLEEGIDLYYYSDDNRSIIKKINTGGKASLSMLADVVDPLSIITVEVLPGSAYKYGNELFQIETKIDVLSWDKLSVNAQSTLKNLEDAMSEEILKEMDDLIDKTNHETRTTIGSGSISIKTSITEGDPAPKQNNNVIPICFAKGTPINTDFGIMNIEDINTYKHTINGKEILSITKSIPNIDEIVKISKNAIKQNVPSKDTYMSKDHKVMIRGKLIECEKLVSKYNNVTLVPYNGVALYNILMKTHDTVMVNNMICETLHPLNIVSKIMNKKMTNKEKQDTFNKLKSKINNTDKRTVMKYVR